MKVMPEHNQYQMYQNGKTSENLLIFLPPPSPPPSSTLTVKLDKMEIMSSSPSSTDECSVVRKIDKNNDERKLDRQTLTCLTVKSTTEETATKTTTHLSPLLSFTESDYFLKPKHKSNNNCGQSRSALLQVKPALPSNTNIKCTSTLQTHPCQKEHGRWRLQAPVEEMRNGRFKLASLSPSPSSPQLSKSVTTVSSQCFKQMYKLSLLSSICGTASFVLFLVTLLSSTVLGMPQTSAMASAYHLKAQQRHHQQHQSTPKVSSPYYSASSSSSLSSVQQSQHQNGNAYQAHGFHNKYLPFSNSYPSSSVQHQAPVKSSSLKQDSNNHHHHQSASSPPVINDASALSTVVVSNASCPNCGRRFDLQEAKSLKLEAIQQQILSKLNLMEKPKVNQNWLKREQALEAIRKAKLNSKVRGRSRSAAISSMGDGSATNRKRHSRRESDTPVHRRLSFSNSSLDTGEERTTSTESSLNYDSLFGGQADEDEEEEVESSTDEYYGKTSEIIAFAEPGKS